MTERAEILGWLLDAKERGATHLIIATDTFDYEDYPVPVMPGEDVREKYEEQRNHDMTQVQEVYALHLDLETQLAERRAFHFEERA